MPMLTFPLSGIAPQDLWPFLCRADRPDIVDVCLPDDAKTLGCLVPGSRSVPYRAVQGDRPTIIVCAKGLKLGQGAAAQLRARGVRATFLKGGLKAWIEGGLPSIARNQAEKTETICTDLNDLSGATAVRWCADRLLPPGIEVLSVAPDALDDVATRFDAVSVTSAHAFMQKFMMNDRLLGPISNVHEDAFFQRYLLGLERIYGPGEATQIAALDAMDALLAAGQS